MPTPTKNTALLSLRTTVILLCALLTGATVAGLTYLGTHPTNPAQATVAGLLAAGATALGLHQTIDT